MKKKSLQKGFTLLEAVVVVVITLTVFAVFGAFMLRFQNTSADLAQRAKEVFSTDAAQARFSTELVGSGTQFALRPADTLIGGSIDLPFPMRDGYYVSGNTLRYGGAQEDDPLFSEVMWQSGGELTWTGSEFILFLTNPNAPDEQTLKLRGAAGKVTLFQGTELLMNEPSEADNFGFRRQIVRVDKKPLCRLEISVGQRIVFSKDECFGIGDRMTNIGFAFGSGDGFVGDVHLTAAEIGVRADANLPVRLPLMPFFKGERLDLPIFQNKNQLVLFAGRSENPLALAQPTFFAPAEKLYLAVRGETSDLQPGNLLFLCDYLQKRSIVLEVLEIKGNEILVLPRIEDDKKSMYSAAADFADYEFPVSARLIKLAPSVEYALRDGDGDGKMNLYRRTENQAWELAQPLVRDFQFKTFANSSELAFSVHYSVEPEVAGENTAENTTTTTTAPVNFLVYPTALNSAYETR